MGSPKIRVYREEEMDKLLTACMQEISNLLSEKYRLNSIESYFVLDGLKHQILSTTTGMKEK